MVVAQRVAIPSITGLHSYKKTLEIRTWPTSRNPFYYRSSFIPRPKASGVGAMCRNPFYYRSSFIRHPFPFSCIDKYLQNRVFTIADVLKVSLKIFLKYFIKISPLLPEPCLPDQAPQIYYEMVVGKSVYHLRYHQLCL